MEKVLEFLEKTHRANWILFTVCLAVMNTFVFYKINGELWNYSVGNNHPFFLFLEIALLSTGLTRILVAINFLRFVQLCPIIADVINWCWWERRKRITVFNGLVDKEFPEFKDPTLFYRLCLEINAYAVYLPLMKTSECMKECGFDDKFLSTYKKLNQDLFGNKPDDFTVPIYIAHECYKNYTASSCKNFG
jgi:hypothetical protein